jgi:glycosyltransferase involved in cell wall biosynthesis
MPLTKPLHILIIPGSWPSKQHPLSGIYIKDFVNTLEGHSKNFYFSVLYMGGSEYGVSFSEPFSFFQTIWRKFFDRKTIMSEKVRVYINPILYIYKFGRTYYENRKFKKALQDLHHIQNKHGSINLIHAHFSHSAGTLAKRISEYTGVPYIITEHAGPFPFEERLIKDGKLREEYFDTLNGAKHVIAVSHSLQNKIQSFGLRNVIYIPNAVNEKKFSIVKKNNEPFVFLAVSSLTYMKGIDILLTGFSRLIKKYPEKKFILRIVGDGQDSHAFMTLAQDLGIEQCTFFCEAVSPEHIGKFYQEAHCLVHASRHESFGLVCAEAQASGLPVIATRCGGPESIVVSPSLGILVENENPELLSETMYDLYQHYDAYSYEMIRDHFMKNFSRKVISKKTISVYIKNAKY